MMFQDWKIDPWKKCWDPAEIQTEDCLNTSPMLLLVSDWYLECLGLNHLTHIQKDLVSKSQLDSQISCIDLVLNLLEQHPKHIAMQRSEWVLPLRVVRTNNRVNPKVCEKLLS